MTTQNCNSACDKNSSVLRRQNNVLQIKIIKLKTDTFYQFYTK